MAGGLTLRREQVIAALLVTGVVVVVGYASGLGLRTTTSAGGPNQVVTGPTPTEQPALPGTGELPQAVSPPGATMPVDSLPAAGSTEPVVALPVPTTPTLSPDPQVPVPTQPTQPAPGQPTVPGQPTDPAAPGACLPGLAQNVADTANTVVSGLPVVSTVTGTLGLTQSPDGSSPGTLNTLLYSVTGYCAPAAPTDPVSTLTGALPAAVPAALPLAGG